MQQVNLYQPIFRKQEKVLSAKTLSQALFMILIGLMLIYLFAIWQSQSMNKQLIQSQKQRDAAIAQLAKLNQAYPQRKKDTQLEKKRVKLQTELKLKQQVVERLSDQNSGNRTGFSEHLAGLARQKMSLLWLTKVGLHRGGQQVDLEGSALKSEQLPQYLQRLAKENSFLGTEFQHFELSQSEARKGQVDFILTSVVEKE
ncbi:MAG: hypothetical protein KAJ19_01890 [Gammaproteobacteria bacterium]|nr:hypothetical protein [Gammaproteobacteria bacterium]